MKGWVSAVGLGGAGLAVLTVLAAAPSARAAGAAGPAGLRRDLAEANRALTYRGAPINPRAVQELRAWLSDSEPGPVAVDLAGTHETNRYFGRYARDPSGRTVIDLRTTVVGPRDDADRGSFSYRRVGTLPGGIHVLETAESGGGSGVFVSLLLVQFAVDWEYDERGARKPRLVMRRVGEIALGDRYGGTVTVKGRTIEIGPDQRNAETPRVIRFP
jgi:hypothetical protein